jgi:mitochondrial enoyl-[acyl-carrier protein] reductase / trans-2-enoyl-CoA reductase
MENTALSFHSHGPFEEVLHLETESAPVPGPRQVLLRMLAAPINPSDLGSIAGTYGELPHLPAVAGREGVAEVVSTGPGVSLPPGQRVLIPDGAGAWQTFLAADVDSLMEIPPELPLEQAAMASINPPTALLLLESFASLSPGSWVIQNAANSGVGHHIIQLCRERGIRTINLVRNKEWMEPLRAAGADAVLLDGPEVPEQVRKLTGNDRPLLGLNSVGGNSAMGLIKSLAEGGTLVTFGGMTGESVRFPTRYLIFNDIRLVGFWLHRWKKTHSREEHLQLMNRVFDLLRKGILRAPVEKTYPLHEFHAALHHASAPGRRGKIVLTPA